MKNANTIRTMQNRALNKVINAGVGVVAIDVENVATQFSNLNFTVVTKGAIVRAMNKLEANSDSYLWRVKKVLTDKGYEVEEKDTTWIIRW